MRLLGWWSAATDGTISHRYSRETTLASRKATHSLRNSATDVSCSTRGVVPVYITDLLHEQRTTRVLRSTTNNDLCVPTSRSRNGVRTCSVSAPRLWNLHLSETKTTCCLVTFHKILKTHLFRFAYVT